MPGDASSAHVRQIAVGKYADDLQSEPLRGRLVWVVSFANPDDVASGFIGGDVGRDRSCDWSAHYDYVFAVIDAETGEFLTSAERGRFDPSRPPRSSEFPVTAQEQKRCERLFKEQRELASEFLTP